MALVVVRLLGVQLRRLQPSAATSLFFCACVMATALSFSALVTSVALATSCAHLASAAFALPCCSTVSVSCSAFFALTIGLLHGHDGLLLLVNLLLDLGVVRQLPLMVMFEALRPYF